MSGMILLAAASAGAAETNRESGYFRIATDETIELPSTAIGITQPQFDQNLIEAPRGADPLDEANVILDKLITLGQKIYKIVEAGKPVYNASFNRTDMVPQGITEWQQLSNWQVPQSRRYQRTIRNLYGYPVIQLRYRIEYTAGGQYNGRGLYLQNVTILPEEVYVAWGYKLDVQVSIPSVTNAGTTENPVAGAQLLIDSKVSTVMNTLQQTESYYVRGDGLFKSLQ